MTSGSGCAENWSASSRHRVASTRPCGWSSGGSATAERAPRRSGCCCCPDSQWACGSRFGRGHGSQLRLRRQRPGRSPAPANLACFLPALASCGSWTFVPGRCGTGASRSCPLGIRRIGSCGVGTSSCSGVTRRSRWTPAAPPPSPRCWCGTRGSSSPPLPLTGSGSGSSTGRVRRPSAALRPSGRWRSTAGSPSVTFVRPRDAGRWRPPAVAWCSSRTAAARAASTSSSCGTPGPAGYSGACRASSRSRPTATCWRGAARGVGGCTSPTWQRGKTSRCVHPPGPSDLRPTKGCSRQTGRWGAI